MRRYIGLRKAIKEALSSCMTGLKPYPFEEPDYTAGITLNLPKEVNAYCQSHNLPLSFGGCFTHQSPTVSFDDEGQTRTCELADLLVLLRDSQCGKCRYNAAFMQLKMVDGTGQAVISKQGSINQYSVYTKWPQLSWKYGVMKQPYNIRPRTISEGAKYLLVDKSPLSFIVSEPKMIMDMRGKDFSDYLYDFICWNAGRPIVAETALNSDDWSRLIWDVLERLTVFNRRKAGCENQPRKVGLFFDELQQQGTCDAYSSNEAGEETIGLLLIDIG